MTKEQGSFTFDLVHSDEQVLHGLRHLMGGEDYLAADDEDELLLQSHETMVIYRNVRKKYATEPGVKEGLRSIETFRTPEQGLEAAYRAALCRGGPTREASAL